MTVIDYLKKYTRFFLILFGLLLSSPLLNAQQTPILSKDGFPGRVDRAYGQDQELVNGMQYYNKHRRSLGSPYLLGGPVHPGSVIIRGVSYDDVWIRYDVHAQHVEVEYRTMNGADNQVILVGDRVDMFRIGNDAFKRLSLMGEEKQFYQVLGRKELFCYISWEKKLVPVSGNSNYIEEFTAAKRSYLLEMDGRVAPFKNKKGFVKQFPEARQKEVKRLIREHHLQLRTASPEQLDSFLLALVNALKEGGR